MSRGAAWRRARGRARGSGAARIRAGGTHRRVAGCGRLDRAGQASPAQERYSMRDAGVKIGIIGDGVVGGALRAWFESQRADVPFVRPAEGLRDRAVIDRADVVFSLRADAVRGGARVRLQLPARGDGVDLRQQALS